jgi:DNA replication protein DnaC
MTEAPQILLNHRLKSLRLPTVLREYGKLAKQAAAEGLDHVQFLARLIELEMIDRERRMIERRIKAAKFPAVKSLDSFDFKAIPALNKMQVLELARCEWVDRRENVIALGPSGTGKTHIALGLGLAACQKGMSPSRPIALQSPAGQRSALSPPQHSSMNSWRRGTNADCCGFKSKWSATSC